MKFDYRRTHTCGELNISASGSRVTLSGWVHKRRDLGGLIFIDLRDRFGLTQLVFDPNVNQPLHDKAYKLRSEWVISIKGTVKPRAQGMANSRMATGEIEIDVEELEILSPAKTPPFSICDDVGDVNEELRLKFRYLDIRRGDIAKHLIMRNEAMHVIRSFLHDNKFIEISTPILIKSSPAGSRDYLVPSRIYPGNFYALPQSPQLFKQLLMISGMDRYYQIATCFRDEDPRADRQPEFTQVDIEMSFGIPDDLMTMLEGLIVRLYKKCRGIDIPTPFPRMSYAEAVEFYGTDRPDLRFGMPLIRLDEIARQSTFTVFLDQLNSGGCVKGIKVAGGSAISRKEIEKYTTFMGQFGLKGLAWIKRSAEGISSSIAKFFSEEQMAAIFSRTELEQGDLLFIAAGPDERVNQGLDHLRRTVAKERNLIDADSLKFLWVVDFPMMKWNPDESRVESEHHPFTAPHPDDVHLLDQDPLKMRAVAYDMVLNGYELGGGSQRIHSSELQEKIFKILNLTPEEIQEKFGFFIEALKYGTPPHLGLAFGLDRLVMMLCQTENIRDVIAFPKTTKASDLMMQAPSPASPKQLGELEIKASAVEITWT
ncbi:MAG: aspartate--tRNA ligase [Rhabdochlamydiaceae bacterium]|jgi:aspartyl-tRNA synthetase